MQFAIEAESGVSPSVIEVANLSYFRHNFAGAGLCQVFVHSRLSLPIVGRSVTTSQFSAYLQYVQKMYV